MIPPTSPRILSRYHTAAQPLSNPHLAQALRLINELIAAVLVLPRAAPCCSNRA